MPPFIEVTDVRKNYRVGKVDVPALRGVSFTAERGEFVSILGPSGSGKSTMFYVLGGLTRADSGRVIIDGDDFTRMSDAERTTIYEGNALKIYPRLRQHLKLEAKTG